MLAILLAAALAQARIDPSVLSPNVAEAAQISPRAEWLHALEACEDPSGSSTIKVLDTNGRYSYSVLQFQMSTWLSYHDRFTTTKENVYNRDLQEQVASYMLDHKGEGNWFTCAKRTEARLGRWPTNNTP